MPMLVNDKYQAPFTYFGGKSSVAHLVWDALGNPAHYIEPFFGSGAVLLNRPNYTNQTETVCDADGHLANVWRALQADPDAVAKWCDWPVNHADLIARKRVLNERNAALLESLCADEAYFDARLAGYWIWAASCWIGHGLVRPGQIPHIGDGGKGVHAKGKRPHIGDGGRGVHAKGQIPHPGTGGMGVREPYNTNIYAWFRQLSERLRNVRVVCGDWTRVCGGNWQAGMGTCGIFFDPPYGEAAARGKQLYAVESLTVADEVREWCVRRGAEHDMRIVLAGYKEEHEQIEAHGWTRHEWSAQGGYANIGNANGKANRHRECLWFSPHCRAYVERGEPTPVRILGGTGLKIRRGSANGR